MLFFKRILNTKKSADEPAERRGGQRYAISAEFPLKAVLNITGRDERGELLKGRSADSWDWSGKLINLSVTGARIQLPPAVVARRGDPCKLLLSLDGYDLVVPGEVAHISSRSDSQIYGLALNTRGEIVGRAYQQLLELIAIGATLQLSKPPQSDPSGYLLERYEGDYFSSLDVWREYVGRIPAAFDFQIRECRVRGLADQSPLQFLIGSDPAQAQPASPAQGAEIERFFRWAVPNIGEGVPKDVRDFLQRYAR